MHVTAKKKGLLGHLLGQTRSKSMQNKQNNCITQHYLLYVGDVNAVETGFQYQV